MRNNIVSNNCVICQPIIRPSKVGHNPVLNYKRCGFSCRVGPQSGGRAAETARGTRGSVPQLAGLAQQHH